MLTVDHYELIRRKHLIEELSIRAISRELGHSRKTIRKVLAHGTPPGYQRCGPVVLPVMDPVAGIVHAWLEQDRHRPPKQRHTAQLIYERLRDEYGFKGSTSTVRRTKAYVVLGSKSHPARPILNRHTRSRLYAISMIESAPRTRKVICPARLW